MVFDCESLYVTGSHGIECEWKEDSTDLNGTVNEISGKESFMGDTVRLITWLALLFWWHEDSEEYLLNKTGRGKTPD